MENVKLTHLVLDLHRSIRGLLAHAEESIDKSLLDALDRHCRVLENEVYPALHKLKLDPSLAARVEESRALLGELREATDDARTMMRNQLDVLRSLFETHVSEEETVILPLAQKSPEFSEHVRGKRKTA